MLQRIVGRIRLAPHQVRNIITPQLARKTTRGSSVLRAHDILAKNIDHRITRDAKGIERVYITNTMIQFITYHFVFKILI